MFDALRTATKNRQLITFSQLWSVFFIEFWIIIWEVCNVLKVRIMAMEIFCNFRVRVIFRNWTLLFPWTYRWSDYTERLWRTSRVYGPCLVDPWTSRTARASLLASSAARWPVQKVQIKSNIFDNTKKQVSAIRSQTRDYSMVSRLYGFSDVGLLSDWLINHWLLLLLLLKSLIEVDRPQPTQIKRDKNNI